MKTTKARELADEMREKFEKELQQAYHRGYTAGFMEGERRHPRPEPCTKNMPWVTVKDFFQKLNEEVDEFKEEVLRHFTLDEAVTDVWANAGTSKTSDASPKRAQMSAPSSRASANKLASAKGFVTKNRRMSTRTTTKGDGTDTRNFCVSRRHRMHRGLRIHAVPRPQRSRSLLLMYKEGGECGTSSNG